MQYEHDDALRSATRRARVVKVDDSKSQQRIDITGLKNEAPKKVWRPQDFGFSSNPPKDSDGIIDQMGSRTDRTVYRDAGHEKYRPKNTPEGGAVLFNHTGDIIRVFKDKLDVVHSKQLNIKIGKGYNAGTADGASDGSPDDASQGGDPNISIVATSSSITITFSDSSVKWEAGKLTLTATKVVVLSPDINLGAEGGTFVALCGGGCATKVRAV